MSGTQNAGKLSAHEGGQRGSRGRKPPGGGRGGCPPTKSKNQKRERGAHISKPATSGTQNAGKPLANGGGQKGGVQGGTAPLAGGVGGVPPRNQKRERGAHISKPATSGTQNAGKPSAHEGGQGGPGGTAPWRGAWGMSPHEIKRGSELPTLANPPRVGPKTPANPQPTGVGKGVQGAQPPGGGRGGCPPTKSKEEARRPH